MSEETRTMQTADTTPTRAPEDAPALVGVVSAVCMVRVSSLMVLLSPGGAVPSGKNYSCLRFTMSFAACLVAPAFSSRKFFPAKRIGAHRSRMRS